MNRPLLRLTAIVSLFIVVPLRLLSQDWPVCGFDHLHQEAIKDPTTSTRVAAVNAAIRSNLNAANRRSVVGNLNAASPAPNIINAGSGTVYQIPVVVHVINKGGALGSQDNPDDNRILSMIDRLNRIYSATLPEYPSVNNGGVDVPIRFVLAKRDPNCNPTNGINRVNGSVLAGYAEHGVKYNGSNGADNADVKGLSNWPGTAYYNIWVVHKISSTIGTVAGYAIFPGQTLASNADGTVLAANFAVANTYLAHEMGHAFGLYHAFQGSGGTSCAANNNCATDGDQICDTEPGLAWPDCSPGAINPCTNAPFAGVQHNVMNYTACPNRFTKAQSDRAVAALLTYRSSLLYSKGLVPPDAGISTMSFINQPPAIKFPLNTSNSGPTTVMMNDLYYESSGYVGDGNRDYIENTCLVKGTLPLRGTTLSVTTWSNRQYVKAWIDLDNDGNFDNSEIVLNQRAPEVAVYPYYATVTAAITPATIARAASNRNLRMRIMADRVEIGSAVSQLSYGQTEDFIVSSEAALPVVLKDIEAFIKNDSLKVRWVTAGETNNDHFDIELSGDGVHFEKYSSVVTKNPDGYAADTEYIAAFPIAAITLHFLVPFLGLLLLRSKRGGNKAGIWSFCVAGVLLLAMSISCSKNENQVSLDKELFVRVVQVDKDGSKSYSKVVKVNRK